jgi:hypothetical protein
MTFEEFEAAEEGQLSGLLLALWFDRRGEWDRAHEVAQAIEDRDGSWVHAYLHRKQGDQGNAAYWYRQAGRPVATGPLTEESEAIVRELLTRKL